MTISEQEDEIFEAARKAAITLYVADEKDPQSLIKEGILSRIEKIHSLAEEMLLALERKPSKNFEIEKQLVIPLINQMKESSVIIKESYINITNNEITEHDTKRIEKAIREAFLREIKFTEEANKIIF